MNPSFSLSLYLGPFWVLPTHLLGTSVAPADEQPTFYSHFAILEQGWSQPAWLRICFSGRSHLNTCAGTIELEVLRGSRFPHNVPGCPEA